MNEDREKTNIILEVENLKTYFRTFEGLLKAVDGVSFSISEKETLGIVGESGCGKTVTALSIMRLIQCPPGKVEGRIFFLSQDLLKIGNNKMQEIRGNKISMIFQNPMSSLNPAFTIGFQVSESFILHQGLNRNEAWERAISILDKVKIPSPKQTVLNYPHRLSGGMLQRVMVAMALSCNPALLIADEPTTALDVTIQSQIIELISQLQSELNTSVILISHNLGVVAEITQNVLVLYAGKTVEKCSTIELFNNPQHPYTQGLLASIPKINKDVVFAKTKLKEIPGTVPNLTNLPGGCSFHPRCEKRISTCTHEDPPLVEILNGHWIRCWLFL